MRPFSEKQDQQKRLAAAHVGKPLRPAPADFRRVYDRLEGSRNRLIDHYHTNLHVITRWCEERGLKVLRTKPGTRATKPAQPAAIETYTDRELLSLVMQAFAMCTPVTEEDYVE